ncbi:MAG: D-cysteine desulfhydrase family protein [Anaerolineaceae bacterium]
MTDRVKLAHLPTPIEPLPRLSQLLNGPELYIKRDDLTGLGMGGNKTRKLEFLVGDALSQGADTLISAGAVQSNHCRQVAAAAARLGLGCVLVLTGVEPELKQGNLLLDFLSGAETRFVSSRNERESTLQSAFISLQQMGKKPYLIPYGGSNAIGALGYADAMYELQAQGLEPDWIVFASSSGGTHAGLILGAHETGLKAKILGIRIDLEPVEFTPVIAKLVNEAATLKELDWRVDEDAILLDGDYCAAGYGVLQPIDVEGVKLFARYEGVTLDPVYTGRAAGGLIDLIRKGFFKQSEKVLFWHTGGAPALFAEPYQSALGK